MPPVEQDALIYGPIRVELLTHKVLAQGKFVHSCLVHCVMNPAILYINSGRLHLLNLILFK